MRIARIVPWTGQEEWDQVSQWLYSEDPDLRLYGVNRVTAWLGRGRVPNAVTSTSMFVHIIYQDQLNTLSELALRSLYTLAIVRFVNGMVDVEQTKVHAQAVSLVAEKLGIPLWLVDLRHAGTHDRVPSLHYLRLAADFVLQWLFDNYWQCQPYGNELEDIKDRISKEIQAFTPTYLSDSLMLEKLVSSISNEHGLEILISSLLTPGVLMPKDPKDCPSFPKLFSSDYIDLWSPLFLSVYISYPSFLERFMNSLIASLVEVSWEASSDICPLPRPSHELDCLYAWAVYFNGFLRRKDRTTYFQRWALQCLSNPNKYTQALFKLFYTNTHDPPILLQLFETSLRPAATTVSVTSSTLEHHHVPSFCSWTRVHATRTVALGLVPQGELSDLSLSVPTRIKGIAVDSKV